MPAHQLWMWLLLTALLSIAAMVAGVISSNQALAAMAGAMFAVWRDRGLALCSARLPELGDHALAARFARLIAAAWAWAGLAMLACYYLTDLTWQHAWQYGAGMLLIAGLVWRYAEARTKPGSRFADATWVAAARWMTRMQGFAALAGVTRSGAQRQTRSQQTGLGGQYRFRCRRPDDIRALDGRFACGTQAP